MKKTKKILVVLLAVVMLCQTFIPILTITVFASSSTSVGSFDTTTIEEDLGSDVLTLYPKLGYGDCEIINFLEYAYSEHSEYAEIYNVYFYVYNPTGKPISMLNEGGNYVTMVTGIKENGAQEISAVDLDFVSKTADNLIYKFKLSKPQKVLSYMKEYVKTNNGVRRYEFTKLQFKYAGGITETKEFSKVFEFVGYAAYCDFNKSPESTLQCKEFINSSISLNLEHTNYRAEAQKEGIQDEINSVYFSIPNRYYEQSESLYGVSAQWYEYKTKPIFVTSDAGAVSGLWNMRNVRINAFGQAVDIYGNIIDETTLCYYRVLWNESKIYTTIDGFGPSTLVTIFGNSYNPKCVDDLDKDGILGLDFDQSRFFSLGGLNGDSKAWTYEPQLDWIIYTDDKEAYKVSSEQVEAYMKSYTNTFSSQPKILDRYASGLFVDSIDVDRIALLENPSGLRGKVNMAFTTNDQLVFIDSDKTQTAWNKFWFGTKYQDVNISPIVVISEGDLVLDADTFSQKYYVNKDDVSKIQAYAQNSYSIAETPVLLRFAVTDYYSFSARFDLAEEKKFSMPEKNGYIAQETLFLDFNVINLDFKNVDGVVRSVGVVAEPIDIINGLTPPADLIENQEWWQKIMMVLMLILLLLAFMFIWPIVSPVFRIIGIGIKNIFKILIWILLLPSKLFRKIFKLSDKHQSKRRKTSTNTKGKVKK